MEPNTAFVSSFFSTKHVFRNYIINNKYDNSFIYGMEKPFLLSIDQHLKIILCYLSFN